MKLTRHLLTQELRPEPGTVVTVLSSNGKDSYDLEFFAGKWDCPCRGYRYNGGQCSHQGKAELRWQSRLLS